MARGGEREGGREEVNIKKKPADSFQFLHVHTTYRKYVTYPIKTAQGFLFFFCGVWVFSFLKIKRSKRIQIDESDHKNLFSPLFQPDKIS